MQTPTIVKQTKDYLLIKVPLPKKADMVLATQDSDKMSPAEKRGWKRLQEAQQDIREGRIITAPSLKQALRRYAKREWD